MSLPEVSRGSEVVSIVSLPLSPGSVPILGIKTLRYKTAVWLKEEMCLVVFSLSSHRYRLSHFYHLP